jgi:hypothetical protein
VEGHSVKPRLAGDVLDRLVPQGAADEFAQLGEFFG